MVFLSHNSSNTPGLVPLKNVLVWVRYDFPVSFSGRDMSRNVCNRLYGSFMVGTEILPSKVPFSRMLHDILEDDHRQWHPHWWDITPIFYPLLIWTLLPNLTFYLIVWGFHRTFATGTACQQRTLTPPDTWSSPTLGLAYVLMLSWICFVSGLLSFEHPSVLLCCSLWEKEEIWHSPMTKAPLPPEDESQKRRYKDPTKNFDYTTIADRLGTVSYSNCCHPTGVVKLDYGIQPSPQNTKAM